MDSYLNTPEKYISFYNLTWKSVYVDETGNIEILQYVQFSNQRTIHEKEKRNERKKKKLI